MSSRLYFPTSSAARPWLWHGVRSLSTLSHRVAPRASAARLRRVLSAPSVVSGASRRTDGGGLGPPDRRLGTPYGTLALYERGEGPIVLMQHGWSGSAEQLHPLVETVARRGFRAVAFDHFRHGASGGTDANLALFVRATEAIVRDLHAGGRRVSGCASHSIGCLAALHAGLDPATAQFMVSPALSFDEHVTRKVDGFGIHPAQFAAVLAAIERDYAFDQRSLDDPEAPLRSTGAMQIVHSVDDPVVPLERSRALRRRRAGTRLCEVPGRGHGKLLRHETTRARLNEWLDGLGASGWDGLVRGAAGRADIGRAPVDRGVPGTDAERPVAGRPDAERPAVAGRGTARPTAA